MQLHNPLRLYVKTMFRIGHTPTWAQVLQPTEISREQQHKAVQSFFLERRQNLLAESASERALSPIGKLLCLSQYPRVHLLPSLLFIGREGDEKELGLA